VLGVFNVREPRALLWAGMKHAFGLLCTNFVELSPESTKFTTKFMTKWGS